MNYLQNKNMETSGYSMILDIEGHPNDSATDIRISETSASLS